MKRTLKEENYPSMRTYKCTEYKIEGGHYTSYKIVEMSNDSDYIDLRHSYDSSILIPKIKSKDYNFIIGLIEFRMPLEPKAKEKLLKLLDFYNENV